VTDLSEVENEMGRPKKQQPEAQAKQEENVQETLEELKITVPLTDLAVGISKTKNGWAVVEIAYNAETGESDLQDVRVAGISKDDAIELFKITAVEKGLV
jgi:hypothetical protein